MPYWKTVHTLMSCKFSASVGATCKCGLLEIHTSQGQCLAPAVNELLLLLLRGVCVLAHIGILLVYLGKETG